MITSKQWEKIEKQASQLYNQLELEIIEEIAERIARVGYANTVVLNNIEIAQEMGILYQDVVSLVAKHNNISENKIKKIFEEAGASSIAFDDEIYKEAGLNPILFKQSKMMLKLIEANAKKTNYNLNNLTMTTANTSQTEFYNILNKSHLEVSSGIKNYSQSIIDAVQELSNKGAYIEYPSGRKLNLESAVRMNIVTSVNQTCGKLQLMRAEELDWDLMEITAHAGARPSHTEWQGQVVSRSGKIGYLSLDDIGYGTVTGFKGVNCRHDWMPFYEGSTRTYKDEELERLKNEAVIYNNKRISKYDAQQIQRKMERTIKRDKRDIVGLQGILKNTIDNKLIEDTKTEFSKKSLIYKTHQNELNDFLKQTSFRKDNTRLLISNMYDKSTSNEIAKVTKLANKYNNSSIVGTIVNGTKITEIGEHIISRTYARQLNFKDIEDTLKNPLAFSKIKIDDKGRSSFYIYGKNVTVAVNPDTGKIATARTTSKREKKKYGIEE